MRKRQRKGEGEKGERDRETDRERERERERELAHAFDLIRPINPANMASHSLEVIKG
jgi:hypothetical protein